MPIGLKTKANLAIAFALIALAGMGWLSLRENRSVTDADRWVSHSRDVLETSESLRAHISDAGIARRIFLQGDKRQAGVFDAAASSSLADLQALRNLTVDNKDQQNHLDQMEPLIRARLAVIRNSIAIHQKIANDEALQKDLTDQSATLVAQLVEKIQNLENAEKHLLQKRAAWAKRSTRRTSTVDMILGLSVFCFIVIATVGLNRELSRRKQAERAIAKQKALLQSILDTCGDVIIVADRTGRIILRNPAAQRLHSKMADGVTEDVPLLLGFYKPDEKTLFPLKELPLHRALQGESVDNVEVCVRHSPRDKSHWSVASSRPLLGENENIVGGVVFYHDITARKELENRLAKSLDGLKSSNEELQKAQGALERLASVDELTGLHNRRGFLSLAEHSMRLARRAQQSFVLVFVDLDGLKWINDTLGHTEGDRAITDAAFVLSDSFRHCDVLCRLGGDEFAVLMVDACEETARVVRERLMSKVEKINEKGNRPYGLSLSVGMLTCDSGETLPLEALLEKADALMYEEKKKKGANRGKSQDAHFKSVKPNSTSPRRRLISNEVPLGTSRDLSSQPGKAFVESGHSALG